jgi:hypothetical protein
MLNCKWSLQLKPNCKPSYKIINVIVMKCLHMKLQLVTEPKFAYYIPLDIWSWLQLRLKCSSMYVGNLQCSLKSCMNPKGLTWNKKYSITAFCRRLHHIIILPILNQKGWDYSQKEWKKSRPLQITHFMFFS